MVIFNKKIPSDTLFRLLFLVLFWGFWLVLPFISPDDDEKHRQFMIKIFPVLLTNIPLFFINTEWLVARVLRKRGVGVYTLSLLILALTFIVIQLTLKSYCLSNSLGEILKRPMPTLFAVFFVTAVSTGYGLVNYMRSEEKAKQQEHQERLQSELSFLRSQISPHFIFNILNSIVYLIRSRSDLAEPVTIKLSELMRYMLYESVDAQILLDKEVGYLGNYIELQRIRFEEDVEIRFQMQGEPESQIIEPMLMIPFVENAFKHGVGMIVDPVIDIQLEMDDKGLKFTVRNKIGPEPPTEKDNSSGIGLRNVKRRLELLYPHTHQLTIKTEGPWFIVVLELQFHEAHLLQKIAHDPKVYSR